jgi:NAD-dependent deacetylase sirtuin 4
MKIIKNKFVPVYKAVSDADLSKINSFVKNAKKLFVLTGAGLSTESGIPDYRSEGVGLYSRTNHK